jgi:hypothetical protein
MLLTHLLFSISWLHHNQPMPPCLIATVHPASGADTSSTPRAGNVVQCTTHGSHSTIPAPWKSFGNALQWERLRLRLEKASSRARMSEGSAEALIRDATEKGVEELIEETDRLKVWWLGE